MKRTITYPYWGNDEKTQVICWFNYDDGSKIQVAVTDVEGGNPDWKAIMDTFTVDEIDEITKKYKEEIEKQKELEREQELESVQRFKTDTLFAAKLEAFEIPSVRNSKNRKLKSAIRKAQSLVEIHAYTTILIMKEMEAEDERATAESEAAAATD